ncbi:TIGR01621 family pseudouridine synthase [Thalassotalea psychrophila]|uniref:TIGR01621 family pseudouridine synthase n=1 Tax=Thalassotalea psychrophila TaxID=3065647 RepID=A0ABY9TX26_9GAMM|nr:TIGR01621 family pseudouridine synthase [Colwelliaceae bacterium SQ149]
MSTRPYAIVFENDDFVVVNKAQNFNFHDEDDLGSGLFNVVKQAQNYKELYPVHRLDKMTSGIVLFAKNKLTATELGKLFEQHKIQKFYLAISKDKPKKKQGWIKGDMEKSRRSSWRLARTMINPALTQFFSYALLPKVRLYIVRPLSGKTHQIRVALNSIGSSIAGDPIYNPSDRSDRGYLHAYALKFELYAEQFEFTQLPTTGVLFQTEEFKNKLEEIGQPWLLSWPK